MSYYYQQQQQYQDETASSSSASPPTTYYRTTSVSPPLSKVSVYGKSGNYMGSSSSSNSAAAELEARFEASRGFDLEDDLETVPRLCRRTTRRRSSSINTNNPTNCIIWTTMGFLSPRQRRRLRRCQRPLQQPRPRLSARALKLSTLPRASSSPARSGCEVLEALCICLPPRVFGPGSLSTQPYIHTYIFMHHPVPATPTTKMAALFYYTTTP